MKALRTVRAISGRQMEFSRAQQSGYNSQVTLLDMIIRSSRRTYKEFIRQLTKTKCHNIARVLEAGSGKSIFNVFCSTVKLQN